MYPSTTNEEAARLGKEIYERDIRALVEADHDGEIVAIDIDTGSWAVGTEVLEAVDRLREQCPDALDVWSVRVGYQAVYSLGGGAVPRAE